MRHDWERSPHNLRSLLTERHVSASDRRKRFVGVDAYVAAGGTLERDLFDEENEGYLADPALLDRLVTERSASLVADLEGQGWAWAEVHLENDYWEALEKYNTLRPTPVDLDPALLAEADKLRAELDAIDQASEDDEPSENAERRRDEIENRLDEIEAGKTANDGAAKAYVQSLGAALHVEFEPLGLNVTVLLPGLTETPVLAKLGLDPKTMPIKPMSVEQCVAEGLKALKANHPTHIPGRMNRIMDTLIPSSVSLRIRGAMLAKAIRNKAAKPQVEAGAP